MRDAPRTRKRRSGGMYRAAHIPTISKRTDHLRATHEPGMQTILPRVLVVNACAEIW